MILIYQAPTIIEPIQFDYEEKQLLYEISYQYKTSPKAHTGVSGGFSSTGSVALDLINKERIQRNLKALSVYSKLNLSAQNKCNDMVTFNYWAHNNPNGTLWVSFINAQGITGYAGEILAKNWTSDSAQHDAWMNSPTHRAAILDPYYTKFGIADCGITVVHFAQL